MRWDSKTRKIRRRKIETEVGVERAKDSRYLSKGATNVYSPEGLYVWFFYRALGAYLLNKHPRTNTCLPGSSWRDGGTGSRRAFFPSLVQRYLSLHRGPCPRKRKTSVDIILERTYKVRPLGCFVVFAVTGSRGGAKKKNIEYHDGKGRGGGGCAVQRRRKECGPIRKGKEIAWKIVS